MRESNRERRMEMPREIETERFNVAEKERASWGRKRELQLTLVKKKNKVRVRKRGNTQRDKKT